VNVLERVHGARVHPRRVRVLADWLAPLLPANARVLDVGCGDGLVGRFIAERRPDVVVRGVDVQIRPHTHIPVNQFDGRHLPRETDKPEIVMFVDVLHHTDDPMVLLREAAQTATKGILIKDHTLDGLLAGPTLRFMDRVSNVKHGVSIPYNYWPKRQWLEACSQLGMNVTAWFADLKIYPGPADWIFGRSLHFVARLEASKNR
jgi:SAM-dependent methyltransferase